MKQLRVLAIKLLAILPSFLKGKVTIKLGHILRKGWGNFLPEPVSSNLGLSKGYHLTLSGNVPSELLFGRPKNYRGEYGALLLSAALTKRSGAFLDIGAHRGYFSFFVRSRCADVPIYGFEPAPELFPELSRNVAANRLKNVHVMQTAVGGKVGKANFYIFKERPLISSLSSVGMLPHEYDVCESELISFDEIVTRYDLKNVCAKVDIENAEFEFLEGAKTYASRLNYLIIEVLLPANEKRFPRKAMEALGMNAYYLNGLRLEPSTDGFFTYRHGELNWLFCRENPAQLREILKGSGLEVA